MSGPKHTPWTIDTRAATHVIGRNGRGICSTGGYGDNSNSAAELADENAANARLITFLPELFEALLGCARSMRLNQTSVTPEMRAAERLIARINASAEAAR